MKEAYDKRKCQAPEDRCDKDPPALQSSPGLLSGEDREHHCRISGAHTWKAWHCPFRIKKYKPAAVESLPQALLFLDIRSFATQRFYQSQYFFSVSRTAPTPAISSAKKEITLPASPTSSRSTPKICAFFRRGITFSAMAASE